MCRLLFPKVNINFMRRPLILILCTGNSCRSQMAEGLLRQALGDEYEVASAGSQPAGFVHPLAIRVMSEIDITISDQKSKHLNAFLNEPVETIITVCGKADQACPIFPGRVNRHHFPFDDPAHAEGSEEEQLAVFRQARESISSVFAAYASGRKDEGLRSVSAL